MIKVEQIVAKLRLPGGQLTDQDYEFIGRALASFLQDLAKDENEKAICYWRQFPAFIDIDLEDNGAARDHLMSLLEGALRLMPSDGDF